MSTSFVTETPYAQIKPVDPGLTAGVQQLRQVLRRHFDADEAERIALCFADPVSGGTRAAVDWYSDRPDDPEPLADLPPDTAEAVLAAVGAIRATLTEKADALEAEGAHPQDVRILRAATQVPSNEIAVYAAGEQPVLVGWGYQSAEPGATPVPAGKWVPRKAQPAQDPEVAEPAGTVLASGPVAAAPAAVAARGPFPWLAWLLWLVFLLLVLAIAYILLTACSVGAPGRALVERGYGFWNRCPPMAVADTAAQDRQAALREAIRDAEIALAQEAQACRVETLRQAQLTPPVPAPDPDVAPEQPGDPSVEEAMDRVREAGGAEGPMQIILEWDGPADLDLHVECGSSRVYYGRRAACGAELDVDAQHVVQMDEPVENIVWADDPPPGRYRVSVDNVTNNNDPRAAIPYRVIVRRADSVETHDGSIGVRDPREQVTEIVIN